MNNLSIAFITTHRLGDALSHTPCIRFLKAHLKDVSISIIAPSDAAYAVFKGNPNIDAVYNASRNIPEDLKGLEFDLIIAVSRKKDSIPICQAIYGDQIFLGGLTEKKIAGMIKKQIRPLGITKEGHACTLTIEALRSVLRITEPCNDYSYILPFTEEDRSQVDLKLHALGIANKTLIGLHLGSRKTSQRIPLFNRKLTHRNAWHLSGAIQFCQKLHEYRPEVRCLATGTNAEQVFTRKLAKACPNVIDVANLFTIKETAALMHRLEIYVTTDTGTLHVASSTPVHILGLFGPANPVYTGPFPGRKSQTIIKEKTMEAISGESVFAAVSDILDTNP